MESAMKPRSITFLQAVIVLVGIGALAILLWEPHLEGRNAHATLFEIYFKDPFLAYVYTASILFFVALYQAFNILRYIGNDQAFSQPVVKSLRTIKYCALAIICFVAGGVAFLLVYGEEDGRPPVVVMGAFFTVSSVVVATAAAVFEKMLQSAVDLKSENDLTV